MSWDAGVVFPEDFPEASCRACRARVLVMRGSWPPLAFDPPERGEDGKLYLFTHDFECDPGPDDCFDLDFDYEEGWP